MPEMRVYNVQTMAMPKAAIDASFLRDLYITIAEPLEDGSFGVRFYFKPLVRWIWFGGIFILLGAFFSSIRYLLRLPPNSKFEQF